MKQTRRVRSFLFFLPAFLVIADENPEILAELSGIAWARRQSVEPVFSL